MKFRLYCPLAVILAVMLTACNDVLDKKPLDIISNDVVIDDPTLVDAYIASLYAEMTVFKYDQAQYMPQFWPNRGGFQASTCMSDECGRIAWGVYDLTSFKQGGITIHGGLLEYWELPYIIIRRLNELIEMLPNSSNSEAFIESRVAEARFLRAFNYFAMVKRYGGVPLVKKVLQLDAPKEELYPKRNSEQEVYDFIISEINEVEEALKGLPAKYGRATQGAALALKCRAALYAGSIAQFGTIQSQGLLGIPEGDAKSYYQESYNAAKKIESLGIYGLYNEDADKVTNYKNIFLKERNHEMIFAQQYNADTNPWFYGFIYCPKPHGYDKGMEAAPYLETAEWFEYTDGRSGKLDREKIQQGLWSMNDLFGGKDPRFFASMWTNGSSWKGGNVTSHRGLIGGDGVLYENEQDAYQGIAAWGNQHNENNFGSGFGIMKMLDETSNCNMDERDGVDCPIFRYGEVVLNLAEAAFELGKTQEALEAVNQIRERAGIALKTSIDREAIRQERKVELIFETHRYWDVRRWRIAEEVLAFNGGSALRFILDYNSSNFNGNDYNADRKFKLSVLDNYDGRPAIFNAQHYYLPITKVRTEQNTNLEENPGYN